jgi:hypothetical protein
MGAMASLLVLAMHLDLETNGSRSSMLLRKTPESLLS